MTAAPWWSVWTVIRERTRIHRAHGQNFGEIESGDRRGAPEEIVLGDLAAASQRHDTYRCSADRCRRVVGRILR
jgi:hypothetical protein